MTSTKLSLIAVVSALSLLACDEDPYGSSPNTAYRIEGTCTQERPWCNEEFDECYASGAQACNACYQIGGIGCSYYCDYTDECRSRHCGRNEGCLTWSHTATLGEQDPAILETCELASAHNAACGQQPYVPGSCQLFAASERPHAAAVYGCIANAACGEEAACDDIQPDEEVARRVCEALTACDLSWTSCDDGYFATWAGWLRQDVKRAGLHCAELPDCGERHSCLQAWISSIDPLAT